MMNSFKFKDFLYWDSPISQDEWYFLYVILLKVATLIDVWVLKKENTWRQNYYPSINLRPLANPVMFFKYLIGLIIFLLVVYLIISLIFSYIYH